MGFNSPSKRGVFKMSKNYKMFFQSEIIAELINSDKSDSKIAMLNVVNFLNQQDYSDSLNRYLSDSFDINLSDLRHMELIDIVDSLIDVSTYLNAESNVTFYDVINYTKGNFLVEYLRFNYINRLFVGHLINGDMLYSVANVIENSTLSYFVDDYIKDEFGVDDLNQLSDYDTYMTIQDVTREIADLISDKFLSENIYNYNLI